jgi:GT2 family glycosyltransferase
VSAPRWSVVVPAYDRPARLSECLAALAALEEPAGGFEVVVVDDGSPTPLEPVTRPYAARVRLERQANAGPAAARNAGAALARGEHLAFTDDDCRPASGWLRALDAAREREGEAMLGGRTVNALPGDLRAEASQQLVDHLYAWSASTGRLPFFPSNNLAVSAAGFAGLGGFDARFPRAAGEDRDLGARWVAGGGRLVTVPDAVVGHAHAMTLRAFWRQHAEYGRGAAVFHDALAGRGEDGVQVEPPAFYTGMLRRPFSVLPPRRALPVAALVGLSQVATAAGFAGARLRAGRGTGTR